LVEEGGRKGVFALLEARKEGEREGGVRFRGRQVRRWREGERGSEKQRQYKDNDEKA
jgi:hypothetical protein